MNIRITSLFLAAALALIAGCSGAAGPALNAQQNQAGVTDQSVSAPDTGGAILEILRDASGVPVGIRVTWTRVTTAGVLGYYIYRNTSSFPDGDPDGYDTNRVDAGGTNGMYDQPDSGTSISFDDNFGPDVGETYYYRVTVVNSTSDESDFSNELNIEIAQHDIDTVSQAGGSIGDEVTITGSWFGSTRNGDRVYFSDSDSNVDVEAASYVSWGDSEIVVTVPYGAADGLVAVEIGGTSVNSPAGQTFDYNEPATSGISPDADWLQNQYINITGTDFGPAPNSGGSATYVYFGTVAADSADINMATWSDTSIDVLVPATAVGGPQNVKVVVAGNDSNTQSFTVLPHIDSLDTPSGNNGDTVTLSGTSFGATQGTGGVTVNGETATVNSWSDTSVEILIPADALDGDIVLTDDYGSDSVGFGFDVIPVITSFTPLRLAPGAAVTISGSGFGPAQGSSLVIFDGQGGSPVNAATYNSWSSSEIIVLVPDGSETGTLTVSIADNSVGSNIDSVTSIDEFVVLLPAPIITGIGQL